MFKYILFLPLVLYTFFFDTSTVEATSFEKIEAYSTFGSDRELKYIQGRVSFYKIFIPGINKSKIALSFSLNGNIQEGVLNNIGLDSSTFFSKIPKELSHKKGKKAFGSLIYLYGSKNLRDIGG